MADISASAMTDQYHGPSDSIKSATDAFQSKLNDSLAELFDVIIANRKAYFTNNPDKRPNVQSVGSLIDSYSATNGAITGALNLIPGPWGLVAIMPDILAVLRNQLQLVYDIGVAHNKDGLISKELCAAILLDSMGIGAGSLVVIRGSKLIVKRASLRFFQQIVALLGGRVTQQMLKSALAKWVPILGAAAMGAWVLYSTKKVGQKASDYFQMEISEDNEPPSSEEIQVADNTKAIEENPTAVRERLRLLANLANIDNATHESEKQFLKDMMTQFAIEKGVYNEIIRSLEEQKLFEVNHPALESDAGNALPILLDMLALAKRDDVIHPIESQYIKDTGLKLGVSIDDMEQLVAD